MRVRILLILFIVILSSYFVNAGSCASGCVGDFCTSDNDCNRGTCDEILEYCVCSVSTQAFDCDDGDSNTQDTCINSVCHNEVSCSSSSSCRITLLIYGSGLDYFCNYYDNAALCDEQDGCYILQSLRDCGSGVYSSQPYCSGGACVECTTNSQCGSGGVCDNNECCTPQCDTGSVECGYPVTSSNGCGTCTEKGLSCSTSPILNSACNTNSWECDCIGELFCREGNSCFAPMI
jgi:Cys-rich repeat protein